MFSTPLHCKKRIWTIGSQSEFRKLVFDMVKSMSTTANVITPENQALPNEGQHIKPFDEIPGPSSHPLIHMLKNFLPLIGKYTKTTRYKYMDDAYLKYGPIVREGFVVNDQKVVSLYDPKDIETAFRSTGKTPLRPILEVMKSIRESRPDIYKHIGVLSLNGQEWYEMRQKVQTPMLSLDSVGTFCPSMDQVAQDFVDYLNLFKDSKGEVSNILKEIYKWALESIGLVVFNTRLGCLKKDLSPNSETMILVNAVQDTFALLNKLEIGLHSWKWFPSPSYRKTMKAQLIVARTATKYINKTLEEAKNRSKNSDEQPSLLENLLRTKGNTMEDVIVMINDILLAGVDTTSHSVGMLLYHLGKNPRVQDKLVEEIDRVMPQWGTPITPAMLQELRYMRACLKETFRMTPITDGNGRFLEKDLVLSGYLIPAGTIVIMQHRTMGKYLFENAEEFRPERWMKSKNEGTSNSIHPFNQLPFGYGTRMCLGRRFAEQEMFLLLSRLLQRYRVEYHYDDVEMLSRFANMPDKPLRITFIERTSSKA